MLSLPNQVSHTFCRKHFRLKYLIELSCCSTNPVAFWVCMWCLLDKWLPSHVFLLNRIALHCIIFVPIQAWFCACPACPFCGIVYCTSMHSNICLGASHLGTLDVQRVDVDHVLMEPNHKTVLGGRVLKSEGPVGATEDPTQSRKDPRPC